MVISQENSLLKFSKYFLFYCRQDIHPAHDNSFDFKTMNKLYKLQHFLITFSKKDLF